MPKISWWCQLVWDKSEQIHCQNNLLWMGIVFRVELWHFHTRAFPLVLNRFSSFCLYDLLQSRAILHLPFDRSKWNNFCHELEYRMRHCAKSHKVFAKNKTIKRFRSKNFFVIIKWIFYDQKKGRSRVVVVLLRQK